MFGGALQNNVALPDTWIWDGIEWTQEQDAGPPARFDHKLAYDGVRDRFVLFGGVSVTTYSYTTGGGWFSSSTTNTGYTFTPLNDTWEYDGAKWTRVQDIGPSPRRAHGMDYDGVSVSLYGGLGTTPFADTWAWHGTHWTQLQDIGPSPRSYLGLVNDNLRQRIVVFGGQNSGSLPLADTWETFEPQPQVR